MNERTEYELMGCLQNQPSPRLRIATQLMAGWMVSCPNDMDVSHAVRKVYEVTDALISGEYPEDAEK